MALDPSLSPTRRLQQSDAVAFKRMPGWALIHGGEHFVPAFGALDEHAGDHRHDDASERANLIFGAKLRFIKHGRLRAQTVTTCSNRYYMYM